jgi:hypothetical protein
VYSTARSIFLLAPPATPPRAAARARASQHTMEAPAKKKAPKARKNVAQNGEVRR